MERLDKIQGWLEESHDRVSGTENSAAAESFLDNAKAEIELDIEHFRRPDVPSMVMVTTICYLLSRICKIYFEIVFIVLQVTFFGPGSLLFHLLAIGQPPCN